MKRELEKEMGERERERERKRSGYIMAPTADMKNSEFGVVCMSAMTKPV